MHIFKIILYIAYEYIYLQMYKWWLGGIHIKYTRIGVYGRKDGFGNGQYKEQ